MEEVDNVPTLAGMTRLRIPPDIERNVMAVALATAMAFFRARSAPYNPGVRRQTLSSPAVPTAAKAARVRAKRSGNLDR